VRGRVEETRRREEAERRCQKLEEEMAQLRMMRK